MEKKLSKRDKAHIRAGKKATEHTDTIRKGLLKRALGANAALAGTSIAAAGYFNRSKLTTAAGAGLIAAGAAGMLSGNKNVKEGVKSLSRSSAAKTNKASMSKYTGKGKYKKGTVVFRYVNGRVIPFKAA